MSKQVGMPDCEPLGPGEERMLQESVCARCGGVEDDDIHHRPEEYKVHYHKFVKGGGSHGE